jgi:hypothetical protein
MDERLNLSFYSLHDHSTVKLVMDLNLVGLVVAPDDISEYFGHWFPVS